MTTTQPLSPGQTARKDEIIFSKGEFWSDEPTWESNLHLTQIILLIKCLEWLWQDREDYFATWNLTIYYSPNQKKSEYFREPDFFVVLGTTRNQNRKSWVIWQEEGKYQPIEPNQQGLPWARPKGWLWSEELGLYLGIYANKLRYFSPKGQLIPTPVEAAILEKQAKESERQQKELVLQQKEYERQQKELALQKIEQLTARLRELGINPDETL